MKLVRNIAEDFRNSSLNLNTNFVKISLNSTNLDLKYLHSALFYASIKGMFLTVVS